MIFKRRQIQVNSSILGGRCLPVTSLVATKGSLDSCIKSVYLSITAASGNGAIHSDEVLKWVAFAEAFPVALEASFENLKKLNDELSVKSVLPGNGLKPSDADVIVFSVIHSSLINLSDTHKEKLPHVLRWMDYIQHKKEFIGLFEKLLLQKPEFEPPVLCASSEDHSTVEPLLPPEGAKIGERVSFSGIDGKPEDVLNPKKKQLEKITPNLFTDDKGVATFKGIPFITSGGPCTSSIPRATIK